VLGLTVKMGSIYTEQGLNKVEVLWRERGDRQVRESVYKQWWAWLSAGLLGGMVLATNGLNLLERIFGG
jgi:hypothetical protein